MADPRKLRFLGIAAAVIGLVLTRKLATPDVVPIDLQVYRAGAAAFLRGESIYAHDFPAGGIELPFIYPPVGALVLSPFTFVSERVATGIMFTISSFLFALAIFLVVRGLNYYRGRIYPNRPLSQLEVVTLTLVLWAFAVSTEPFQMNANYAQVNVLIMTLVIADLFPRKRFLPQGSLIGLAIAIKLTPLAMLLYFAIRLNWRAILTAFSSFLACTGVVALFRPHETVEFYTKAVFETNEKVGIYYITNQSLQGMISRWFPSEAAYHAHESTVKLVWLVLSLALVVLVALLMRALIRKGLLVDAVFVNALLMLLISPISWSHHWVWLPLAAIPLGWHFWHSWGSSWLIGTLAAATGYLLIHPGHWQYGDTSNGADFLFPFGQKLMIASYVWLGLAILMVYSLWQRHIRPHEAYVGGLTGAAGSGDIHNTDIRQSGRRISA